MLELVPERVQVMAQESVLVLAAEREQVAARELVLVAGRGLVRAVEQGLVTALVLDSAAALGQVRDWVMDEAPVAVRESAQDWGLELVPVMG